MNLVVRNLSFAYDTGGDILKDVSFQTDHGEILAVLGPNGVGKTTLFRCILGFHRRYRGSILIKGREARTLGSRKLSSDVAYIPQSHGHTFNYSVLDMVLMGTTPSIDPLSVPGKRQKEAAYDALARIGGEHLATSSFAHLSGGERQLVLIARALAQNAGILLMDEPTSNLDYGNQTRILQQIRLLADDGYTILLSSHNPQQALWYADTILAMENGSVAAFGNPCEVMNSNLLRTLYGIEIALVHSDYGTLLAPRMFGDSTGSRGEPLHATMDR
ncbi:MAG: ABC transporter ATP-binding protein [Spirochaetales bacterium]|nr:ABC transporter ATP-binding protein [Spirochaetales bacterium]